MGPLNENAAVADTAFLEKEDIVAKIQHIQEQEIRSPYQARSSSRPQERYWDRIMRVLEIVPQKYHRAALALFANAVYLPEALLKNAWEFLGLEIMTSYELEREELLKHCWIAEFEREEVMNDFLHVNRIEGRKDVARIADPGALIEKLVGLLEHRDDSRLIEDLQDITSKQYWILLVDASLSGTSLASEIEKLIGVRSVLKEVFSVLPHLIVCAQVITEIAMETIREKINNVELSKIDFKYAMNFDRKFSIESDRCTLFSDSQTREAVREFCSWVEANLAAGDEALKETRRVSGGDLALGFKNCGWTIVTYRNCPSDSVIPLWYESPEIESNLFGYSGPFPYVQSRIVQKPSADRENLAKLIENRESIVNALIKDG